MENSREKIDASVRGYVAEKRRSLDAHPEVEELVAYHRCQLTDTTRETIRDHLALCEECTQLVLDLANFSELEPPSDDYRLSTADVAAQREDLLDRIRDEETPAAKILEFGPQADPEAVATVKPPIPWWYHTAAAALLVATIGLGYRELSRFPGAGTGAERPISSYTNVVTRFLLSEEERFRGGGEKTVVYAPPEDLLILRLTYLGKTSYQDYRVEVFDDQGRFLWGRAGYRSQDGGQITVIFPPEHRSAARFQLKLYGMTGAGPELLAEYSVVVSAEKPAPIS